MELKYTAKNIRRAEKEHEFSFFAVIDQIGNVSGMLEALMAGGLSEDEASDFMDENGLEKTTIKIMEALCECGFLPETSRIQMKKALAEAKKAFEKENPKASQKSGEKMKQEPSK